MYGCMDVWMYVCMDVWMYGCMDVWMWMYGCMDVGIYGCMDVCMWELSGNIAIIPMVKPAGGHCPWIPAGNLFKL